VRLKEEDTNAGVKEVAKMLLPCNEEDITNAKIFRSFI
jgi:hypothetical protein